MKTINLNDQVKVKLTALGRQRLSDRINDLMPNSGITSERMWPTGADGFTTMQLWEVCHHLGPGMGCGMPLVCETKIEVIW